MLTGRLAQEALTLLEVKCKGSLYAFSDAFFAAMLAEDESAEVWLAGAAADEPGSGLDQFIRRQEELSEAWSPPGSGRGS